MKKVIPILLVALLLALGLTLPEAEHADAVDHFTVNKSVSTDTATVGDSVAYGITADNSDIVSVDVLEVCDDLIDTCSSIGWTIPPGGSQFWGFTYQVTEGDIGILTNCANVTFVDNAGNVFTRTDCVNLTVEPLIIDVDIDIKPGSDPNSFNVKSKGVLPVAILGTPDFDVTQIDPASIRLTYPLFAGISPEVPPLRWNWEDVNEDGIMDLVFKFDMQSLMVLTPTLEPDGAEMVLQLNGNLKEEFSGTPIAGEDTLRILNK